MVDELWQRGGREGASGSRPAFAIESEHPAMFDTKIIFSSDADDLMGCAFRKLVDIDVEMLRSSHGLDM